MGRLRITDDYVRLRRTMRDLSLVTVCEEAGCPNIFECWSDGTATSLLEAMSCGLFPILSDIPQNADWVDASRQNGMVIPLDQPQKLADAFAKAIARPEVRDRFLATGTDPYVTSPKQFADLIRSDGVRWAAVIKKAQVKAE